jgi:hypothetical protein
MPAAFTDASGRVWNLTLNVGRLQKLSGLLGGKALDVAVMLKAVYLDLESLLTILRCLLADQGGEEWIDLLDADGVDRIRDLLIDEYLRFFPAAVRSQILANIAALKNPAVTPRPAT